MALVAERADAFEEASIDEAYLDLSSLTDFENAEARVRAVKAVILEREGLTCSAGIAPNKLIAKIASDFRKPDGLTVVTPDEVQAFLDPLSIRVIPGIGPKTGALLRARGIGTIAELRQVEATQLVEWLGKWGHDLHARARGVSDSPVSNEWERKSVGEQETFERDTLDQPFVLERARALAGGVFERMRADGFQGFRTVTITVRYENFVTLSRSLTAGRGANTGGAGRDGASSCSRRSSTSARTPETGGSASSACASRSWRARVSRRSAHPTGLDVQMEDLSRRRRDGRPPLDSQQLRVAPGERHQRLAAGADRRRLQKRRRDGGAIEAPDGRMHQQPKSRAAVLHLVLDELVVGGPAAELLRQHLLEDPDEIGIEERHAGGRQLLVAADRVEMRGPSERLERTAAPALRHHGLIAERDVQEDHRRPDDPEGRDEQRLSRQAL